MTQLSPEFERTPELIQLGTVAFVLCILTVLKRFYKIVYMGKTFDLGALILFALEVSQVFACRGLLYHDYLEKLRFEAYKVATGTFAAVIFCSLDFWSIFDTFDEWP